MLDAATRAHLELFENGEDGSRRAHADRAHSTARRRALGARRLARWLAYPLLDPDAIARAAGRGRRGSSSATACARGCARRCAPCAISSGCSPRPRGRRRTPRDLGALRGSLEALPRRRRARFAAGDGAWLLGRRGAAARAACRAPEPVPELAGLLREALVDDPPAMPRGSRGANETGYVRAGFHAELDALREAAREGPRVDRRPRGARARAHAASRALKIRFHPVHGYGYRGREVAARRACPATTSASRRSPAPSASRTPELREIEAARDRRARARGGARARALRVAAPARRSSSAAPIRAAADAVAELDALASLAEVARRDGWVRPDVDASERLEIRAGRHPVVEALLARARGEAFVPNDTRARRRTARSSCCSPGPNMSGKSTYLRQVALIVLLAQIGSFVPAESARIGVVDRIFTRVGASDRLARGESTFMVEMRETAEILARGLAHEPRDPRRDRPRHQHLRRPLDRLGGRRVPARHAGRCAAHALRDPLPRARRTSRATQAAVANAHFEVREWGDDVIFLRRLAPGGASRSYGIQVARLAGAAGAR